ncbi:hypothetical protein BO78DRAFT_442585 [Aspergillus sclerotiicarbonarius CBS 121057]|uniref:FAD-binding domain-containing protein n=1 Tax=Aspergillus sclerotiicarbonarius (strain CBS 121057 / IBT 28362) TaxID=1448318 RepID=A0A319EC60_ASPSB|nr:hypothetical protein BO78DRAFT_442585 [Aspergillus sclerotiicarbonarius CBS 121057]
MTSDYDVVIVGAGPVGLLLSCELRLAGLIVLLLERRTDSEGLAETRAFVMHARSLEIFAAGGILEHVFGPETDANYVLLVPQYRTEEIFRHCAEELGAVIVEGVKVQSINPTDHNITVTGVYNTTKKNGQTFTVTGRYLVGADSVRSTVRELAQIDFVGNPPINTVMSGEAMLGVPMPNPYIVRNKNGLVIAADMKVPSGRTRLNVFVSSQATIPEPVPVTLEELNEGLRMITGVDYKLSNPCMLKRFSNEQRLASRYQSGRVFIVGDACHNLPAGGQGLNMGFQEALNLGWKLGAVIRDSAPSSLLHTYEDERLPAARAVVQNTTSQSLLFFASTSPEWAVRNSMEGLLRVPEASRDLALEISGFAVSYPKPLDMLRPDGWQTLPKNMQGVRALDVKIRTPDGVVTKLSEHMRDGRWIQLMLPGTSRCSQSIPAFGDWTVVVEVSDMPDREERAGLYTGDFSEIPVRPDGYLAFERMV